MRHLTPGVAPGATARAMQAGNPGWEEHGEKGSPGGYIQMTEIYFSDMSGRKAQFLKILQSHKGAMGVLLLMKLTFGATQGQGWLPGGPAM